MNRSPSAVLREVSERADEANRELLRAVISAVAFLHAPDLESALYERLADPSDALLEAVRKLVGIRAGTEASDA